jgi:hypothetical protein
MGFTRNRKIKRRILQFVVFNANEGLIAAIWERVFPVLLADV